VPALTVDLDLDLQVLIGLDLDPEAGNTVLLYENTKRLQHCTFSRVLAVAVAGYYNYGTRYNTNTPTIYLLL
jgi:hypothetical protein